MLRLVLSARRLPCLRLQHRGIYSKASTYQESAAVTHETDEFGVPLKPTWSVRGLLDSYPRPILSPETLAKLHSLSALLPPEKGTPEHATLTKEVEDLIKLVEAVRLPELTPEEKAAGIPDGRIWAHHQGIELERHARAKAAEDGRELLRHAAKTEGGLYVVEADRTPRVSRS